VVRPWLGISAQDVTADIADSMDIRARAGVLIASVHKASPARKAGLQPGDVVTAVNGHAVRAPAEMKFRMATVPIGENAVFEVERRGEKKSLTVAAVPPPEDPPRRETKLSGGHPLNGATIVNINPAVATELGIQDESG